MPCFVITSPAHRGAQAILCDPGPLGHPDRRTDVPIKVAVTEKSVTIDDEPQRAGSFPASAKTAT